MGNETPSAGLKVDYWMPLDIGRFLQDTMHLSTEEVGAYMLLLLRYWGSGALPNDQRQLAQTARLTPDAWSIAFASLSMFFSVGEDGLLHQKGADRRRAVWMDKRQKAHEKAQKAANARWSKERAKTGGNVDKAGAKRDAPSIARAVQEQCPTPVVQVQKQKKTPPTPPPAEGGSEATPAMLQASNPPAEAPKGETLAKPAIMPAVAPARAGHRGNPAASTNGSATGKIPTVAPRASNGAHPPKSPSGSDGRFAPFQDEVCRYYRDQNPDTPALKWIRADRGALIEFLANAPSIGLDQFKNLLHNRADSEVNPADPPRLWLRDLLGFSNGPLDRFKKQLRAARAL